MEEIAAFISNPQNHTLSHIYLWHCSLHDDLVTALVQALGDHRHVCLLSLGGNAIGDAGALELASLLKLTNTLSTLNLHGNRVGNSGARALAEALQFNTTLTSLDVENNAFTAEGATLLAYALNVNATLVEFTGPGALPPLDLRQSTREEFIRTRTWCDVCFVGRKRGT
jgi:Ran GTPase-activating protein (RanGAP) involved in mRNA processing and transport